MKIQIVQSIGPVENDITGWKTKCQSVIFVKNEEDKDYLFNMLREQDYFDEDMNASYWDGYRDIIRVNTEPNFTNIFELRRACQYNGKADIYNIKNIRTIVPFVFYQYIPETNS